MLMPYLRLRIKNGTLRDNCGGLGAALGAWLRWWVWHDVESGISDFPFGTLMVNLLGGYRVSLAMEYS